ncbi:helix-turn-helix domain-containing protein [Pseudonocardia lacus]|uniref:helix-turn-helix domain-containing protein n=1 Tax=Pseudonocardia lacus TaxID=2835865 RepID=UPI001BDBF896|nr:helix-turn-helix transcriptional regulator [Pseudonocardia lacus]
MRRELGGFLQQRRRNLGLRREEVAAKASVGYDWYVRIEQGRGRASSDVLVRVCKVLELDKPEIEYVLDLAEGVAGLVELTRPPEEPVPDAVLRVMRMQDPAPSYVLNSLLDLLAWNECSCEFYGVEFGELPAADRNLLWLMLTHPGVRDRLDEWESHANRLVVLCRTLWAGMMNVPHIEALVARLESVSDEFRHWWSLPLAQAPAMDPVRKKILDPALGALVVDQTAWLFGDKSGRMLILSTPAEDAPGTAEKLAELAARRAARALR